ncbi:MAG: T9SS type A sorting domain-containing protein [Rhodothermales bacterium]
MLMTLPGRLTDRGKIRPRALLLLMAGLLSYPAMAQTTCRPTLLGIAYDVFEAPPIGLYPNFSAISNSVPYEVLSSSVNTATAVGWVGVRDHGVAVTYNPVSGFNYLPIPDQHDGMMSQMNDITEDGRLQIGWSWDDHFPVHSDPPRAFIVDEEHGLRYLDAIYESVAQLAATPINGRLRGTVGLFVERDGGMLISHGFDTALYYHVTADGVLTPVTIPNCGGFPNDAGQYPPPGERPVPTEGCTVQNLVQGTNGDYVGRYLTREDDGTTTVTYHRNREVLPGLIATGAGSTSYVPDAVNAAGYIGGYPGILWSPDNDLVDVRAELQSQCASDDFAYNSLPDGIGLNHLLVNDQNWLAWSNLLMRPACPAVSIAMSSTGLSFASGNATVQLGNRFTLTTTVTNDGRVPLEHLLVSPDPKTPGFFRVVSPAHPPFPETLDPGARVASTTEYEAIAPGTFTGSVTVAGDGNCGAYTYVQPPGTIVVQGQETVFVVNEIGDAVDADATDGRCDIDTDSAENNCTLRAAIEESGRVTSGLVRIHFNLPGTPVITPASPLPVISRAVVIDATTQPVGNARVSGAALGAVDGLRIAGANDVAVRGLAITDFGGWGIRIDGGAGHTVESATIGYLPVGGAAAPNVAGGIVVTGGATDVTIGGESEALQNRIFGGVVVDGASGQGVRLLRNEIEVDPSRLSSSVTRVPFDIGADGPTCAPWEPGALMPPPRLLSVTPTQVTGITRPGATVVVYAVTAQGTERGRYWGRWVKAAGTAKADVAGNFSAVVDLEPRQLVTASAVDVQGNSSELAQVRRPVIYAPGIGGSWLVGNDGFAIWIPVTAENAVANDRLARMAMYPDGSSVENVVLDGVLDQSQLPYNSTLTALEAVYPGDRANADRAGNDLWRFPYDWRLNTYDVANDLHALIDALTSGQPDVARACEVDLVAHSNGGVVSNVYVRRDAEHARDHLHRYITVATPYLGAAAAARGHLKGDVFGVDEVLGFTIQWGRMIEMVRNMPGAYGLLPSRAYWDALNPASLSHRHGYVVQDLAGTSLPSFDATTRFFAQPKVDPTNGRPLGLARNADIWAVQDTSVHALIDDWSDWDGPPQVFRQVGILAGSTVTGWRLRESVRDADGSVYEEPGDTPRHVDWRSRLVPIMGTGDGTVPLVSATLGWDRTVGSTDYSGVDSPWIEPFEYYPCSHTGIVTDGCQGFPGSPPALERVVDILRSGYEVPTALAGKASGQPGALPGRELLYVASSSPISVWVEDGDGVRTGPTSPNEPYRIAYGLPTLDWQPGDSRRTPIGYVVDDDGVTLSLPTDSAYTVTIQTSVDASAVRVTRVRVDGADALRRTLLFDDQPLKAGGALRLVFAAGDTPDGVTLGRDGDGDGTYEADIPPAAQLEGAGGTPAVPLPSPSAVYTQAESGESVSVGLVFPDLGGPIWGWTLSETADWIEPSATFGTTPGIVTLTLTRAAGNEAVQTAVVDLVLNYESYSMHLAVPVELRTGVSTAVAALLPVPTEVFLDQNFPNPFAQTTQVTFGVPAATSVSLVVYDMLGRKVAVLIEGAMSAGVHSVEVPARTLPSGVYVYRLSTPAGERSRRFTVVR